MVRTVLVIYMSKPKESSSIGFWVVVICVIAVFTAMRLYYNYNPYTTSSANTCINNLRQIDAAAQEFALEKVKPTARPLIIPTT
jgi:hypothetical protein